MYAIVDKDRNICEYASKYYRSQSGAKNAFNRARECYMQKWMWDTYGMAVRNDFTEGWYKWVFKSHLNPLDCVGKTFDPGLFPGSGLTQAQADALYVKWKEFNDLYEIREVEMQVSIK